MGTVGIWCIGDVNYLVAVLNALAMLSNSGLFIDLFRVGLILAVLLIAFEALFRGGMAGGVPWARFIVAIIVFKFLFGTTCTVQVNDTYSLQSVAVDNVPYGVAITGSIFSTVAHEITLALEQAFSMPTMTDAGFGGPLQALAKGHDFITGLDTLNNGKITKTLEEYADKCTSTGINMGELDIGAIQTASDPWAAMKWNSDIYFTTTWLPSDPPTGTVLSCTDAWNAINNYLQGQLWSDWNGYLSSQICPQGQGSCDPVATVQSALDALAVQQQDARNYMLAAVLLPAFEQGQKDFDSFMGKPEMAVVVGQAEQQRNVQWVAEGSLFMNIARPMMAFFEGFLYAITPFMALLIAFVPSGLSLVGKYIMMFVWVQLWMPVMAILNQYMEMVAQGRLAALINGNIPLTSLQGHFLGMSALNDWLATAGVLVASTPAISLALLFGGSYAMINLSRRLSHGEHIDDTIAAPNIVQPSAIMGMNPQVMAGDSYGLRATGMEQAAGEMMVGQQLQSQVASTHAQWEHSGVAAMNSFREMMSSGIGGSITSGSGIATHDGHSAAMTTGQAFTEGYATRLTEGMGWDNTKTQELAGMLSAGLGAGGGISMGMKGADTPGLQFTPQGQLTAKSQGQIIQRFGDKDGNQIIEHINQDMQHSGSHDLRAMMQHSVSEDLRTGQATQYLEKYGKDKLENVESAFRKTYDDEQRYNEAVQMQRTVGSGAKINLLQNAGVLQDKYGVAQRYADMIPGVRERMPQETEWAKTVLHAPPGRAEWVALQKVLGQQASKGNTEAGKWLTRFTEDGLGPHAVGVTGDPRQNKEVLPSGVEAGLKEGSDRAWSKSEGLASINVDGQLSGIQGQAIGHPLSEGYIAGQYANWGGYISNKGVAEMREKLVSGHEKALEHEENLLGPLKNSAQSATDVAMGAEQTMANAAHYGIHLAKDQIDRMKLLTTSLIDPGKLANMRPENAWIEAREGYHKALIGEANARGLKGAQAELYAQTRMNTLATALGKTASGIKPGMDTYNLEQQAIRERTSVFMDHGVDPDHAKELATREARLIKEAGATGGINYVAPIGQFSEQAEKLDAFHEGGREMMLMGLPGHGRISRLSMGDIQHNLSKETSPGSGVKIDDIVQREVANFNATAKYKIDPNLVRGMIQQESKWNPGVYNSKSQATGLMQITPATAKKLGISPALLKNEGTNIRGGVNYLGQLLNQYHGNEAVALAAYNAGPENVNTGKAWTFAETRHYVPQVLAYRQQYASMDQEAEVKRLQALGYGKESVGSEITEQDLEKLPGMKGVQ